MDNYKNKLYAILNKEFVDEFVKLSGYSWLSSRTPKYSTEYYLYHIILVLTDLKSWKSLQLLMNNKPKNHYKTIQDKHYKWSQDNIYERTYKAINKKYHQNQSDTDILNLFIDSTNIYNKYGHENIGYGQNPKKQESRISAICDENKNIHSLILVKSITKTDIKNTLPHDSSTIIPSLDNLLNTNLKYKEINLIGDKGYATNEQTKKGIKDKYRVNLVYPHKRNQIIKTSDEHKKLLKHRYVIENVFCKLKVYDRITVRKDKKECTYMGFAYLASMLFFKK